MNQKFHEYVTSGIFNLTLTRNQIQALAAIYCGKRSMINHTYGVGALKGCMSRGLVAGLIDRIGEGGIKELASKEGFLFTGEWMMAQPFWRIYWLTHVGELVCELLKEADLFEHDLPRAPILVTPWKVQSKAWREKNFFRTFKESVENG